MSGIVAVAASPLMRLDHQPDMRMPWAGNDRPEGLNKSCWLTAIGLHGYLPKQRLVHAEAIKAFDAFASRRFSGSNSNMGHQLADVQFDARRNVVTISACRHITGNMKRT